MLPVRAPHVATNLLVADAKVEHLAFFRNDRCAGPCTAAIDHRFRDEAKFISRNFDMGR